MITVRSAQTSAIKDNNLALTEIMEQLQFHLFSREHGVAIITCYSDFIDNGLIDLLVEAIPYDIAGITTVASANMEGYGEVTCSVIVYMSDEITFSSAMTQSITKGNMDANIANTYKHAAANHSGRPAMILAFAPYLADVDCAEVVASLDQASGGVPIFGGYPIDHTPDLRSKRTILNYDYSYDRMCIILFYGDIHPTFLVTTVSDQYINNVEGIVTKAEGSHIIEVDNEPFVNFLIRSGMVHDGALNVITTPFLVDLKDGSQPVLRAISEVSPEGHGILSTTIREGAGLRTAELVVQDVLESEELVVDTALSLDDVNSILFMPCISRFTALGSNRLAGMETVCNLVDGRLPFLLSYCYGEICPVPGPVPGQLVNSYHNFSTVACIL
ncbi:MAG: FIST C-terminal domain-containing protein [Clostridiales Family XIII bacterium]|nr:FIST C-terminal domain-containing protein [Clostridiales Family XIII bacterium]